jgi:Mrp family chromosome partitioning ATPase
MRQLEDRRRREHPRTARSSKIFTEGSDLAFVMADLESLVGLTEVKQDVVALVNLLRIRRLRAERGLPNPPMSLHMVFTGNPGTGKTTVARILSRLYKALGLLSEGTFTETDRLGLAARYVGQTALPMPMGGTLGASNTQ